VIITAHTLNADTATITRAAGSTTAKAWAVGDRIEARVSSSVLVNITSSATNAASAKLTGGGAGAVVYQTGTSATGFSAAGTSGNILISGGTGAPTWGALSPITNSLAADVALNNAANYFTGPTVAQGTTGAWFAAGSITVSDPSAAGAIEAKLWDGTTVIASGHISYVIAQYSVIALSGYITSPVDNLRISAKCSSSTTAKIYFNASGNSKDSTITAIRIG